MLQSPVRFRSTQRPAPAAGGDALDAEIEALEPARAELEAPPGGVPRPRRVASAGWTSAWPGRGDRLGPL